MSENPKLKLLTWLTKVLVLQQNELIEEQELEPGGRWKDGQKKF